jgi:acyl-CoA reductase-like NAD-dependent aldehyde dehydrogenase
LGVISAITPFNHPMNQVAHKVVPAIATNNRMVLKPSEKVPLSALLLADILYEAGLPQKCSKSSQAIHLKLHNELLTNPNIELVTFTGGVAIGKHIAKTVGYRRMVLELGGNDPIIVMEDADLEEASSLAVSGSYKNSGTKMHSRLNACLCIPRWLKNLSKKFWTKPRQWHYRKSFRYPS